MSLPASNTYNNLGGELGNYAPVVDPTTDLPASADDEARADVAAMTRMIPRAYVAFTISGSAATVIEHDSVWGKDVSVVPEIDVNDVGFYNINWPASVTDARAISHALNLRRGWGNVEGLGFTIGVRPNGPNGVQVLTAMDGSAVDPDAPIVVWVL